MPDAADYGEGTIATPLRPSVNHIWQNNSWVHVAPSKPTPEELRARMPPITKRQLRLTLVRNGISLAQVEQSIAAMPEGLEKQEAEIEWQDASQFNRLHLTLLLVATALSLTPEQVDAMWEAALIV
ncbi:hypothetical protein [Pseudochrobactrum kiredjianiae]|nr:hypothetical protein [Pseudochrobactrum kiredjianiae]